MTPWVVDGRYRLERSLGRGGMGEVYLATQLVLDRPCAVKLLASRRRLDAGALARFRVEAEALGRLDHPGVVRITDFGVDERLDTPFLVMEYVEGRSLREVLRNEGGLPLERAAEVLGQVAAALDYAHEHGVVHGDVKPDNVVLVEGERGRVSAKLLDLGLARFVSAVEGGDATAPPRREQAAGEAARDWDETENHTRTAPDAVGAAGTLAYMAPELLACRPPSPESDRFAFAVMAYELVCGQRPPVEKDVAPGTRGRDVPVEVVAVISAALNAAPGERPTATTLSSTLSEVAHGHAMRNWRRRERPRRLALALVGAALGAGVGCLGDSSGMLVGVERRWLDACFRLAPTRPPDHRLVRVEIDDRSLAADPTPLVERGDSFGRLLARALDAGASGVGIDIVLPAQWGEAPGFVELVVRHPGRVVLARQTANGRTLGDEATDGLITVALGPDRVRKLYGVVNVMPDDDGVIRHARPAVRDVEGGRHPTFAAKLAALLDPAMVGEEQFLIDFRIDLEAVERLGVTDLETLLNQRPGAMSGKALLVGQTFVGAGDDHHRAPIAGDRAAQLRGLDVQCAIANTLLEDRRLRAVPAWVIMVVAGPWIIVGVWAAERGASAPRVWLCFGLGLGAVVATALFGFACLDRCLAATAGAVAVVVGGAWAYMLRRVLPAAPATPEGEVAP